jgi:hypothetical protein
MKFKLTPTYEKQLEKRVKWKKLLDNAQRSWPRDFPGDFLCSGKLESLADLIDKTFLDGNFSRQCKVTYAVEDHLKLEKGGPTTNCSSVCAGYDPKANKIIFYRKAWEKRSPSHKNPIQTDGMFCFSKLEWAAHALAHEMVHGMVHNLCPETSTKPSYTMDNCHGIVFRRLSKHLFGHIGANYTLGWDRTYLMGH